METVVQEMTPKVWYQISLKGSNYHHDDHKKILKLHTTKLHYLLMVVIETVKVVFEFGCVKMNLSRFI